MNPATWKRVRELFHQLDEVPSAERQAWLDGECVAEPEVRRELERLLSAEGAPSEWLAPPGDVGWLMPEPGGGLRPGMRCGPYKLLSMIGSGGMGTVYCAEQEHPRRLVALKTLRADVTDDELLRRFRTEAEVLGHLRHPGIAQIYDAGTHVDKGSSVPYIVMEYVEGARSLVEHADQAALGERERLELFLAVCEAVHHGHQKGVIHRDLKPGNVLVDAEGRPKVIDFGLARPLDPEAFEFSFVQTRAGEILGTLAYMSPEHVSGRTFDIDTRSDVYSLGGILCELLTGAPPHDLAGLPVPAAVRRIAEEEPALAGRLSGDLRWILEKALAREPDRRYASASELAADIRRFLGSEPVAAGPPSAFYRLTRLARRHRTAILGAAAVVVALSIGLLRARAEARNAEQASAAFEQQAMVARTVSMYLTSLFDPATSYRGGRGALVIDALAMAERQVPNLEDPTVRAIVSGIVGKGFLTLDDRERAEPLIVAAVEALRELRDPDDLDRLHTEVIYADFLEENERIEESRALSEELLPRLERALGPAHEITEYLRYNLAVCCNRVGDWDRAAELYLVNLQGAEEKNGSRSIACMNLLHRLGCVRDDQGRLEEALADIEEALDLARTLGGVSPLYEATFLMDLAGVQNSMGNLALALTTYKEVELLYGRLRPTASNRFALAQNLAWSLLANGDVSEARRRHERARDLVATEWSEHGFRYVENLRLEAAIASASGDHGLAGAAATEALNVAETSLPAGSPWAAACRETLVEVLLAGGDAELACEEAMHAHELASEAFGARHVRTLSLLATWTRAAIETGNRAEAVRLARDLLERTADDTPFHDERRALLARAQGLPAQR